MCIPKCVYTYTFIHFIGISDQCGKMTNRIKKVICYKIIKIKAILSERAAYFGSYLKYKNCWGTQDKLSYFFLEQTFISLVKL